MLSWEEVVVREPEDTREAWRSLLTNNQYDQITTCLETAYSQAVENEEMEKAALLAAAQQLCASCAQLHQEVSYHQQAHQQVEIRRDQMDGELKKLLEKMRVQPDTAVSTANDSFWRRMRRLWYREPVRQLPELQNGKLSLATAVTPTIASKPTPSNVPLGDKKPASPQLTIYCLGQFRVYEDDQAIEEWSSRKGRAIFKYLLLHRQQRITKDVLMAQFWPDSSADAARNNLNVAIYGLRQALRNRYPNFSHILFQDDCYFLNPAMNVWMDVEQFATVFQRADQLWQRGDTAVALREFHAAEALYQGDLLAEDPYEEWPTARRHRLQCQYMQVLTHLSEHYFAAEQYATCLNYANKLLSVEPCHEATHCLMMRAYARQRQGYLALRQYYTCVQLLAEELAVPPSPATTHLYEAIRQHQAV